MPGRRETVAWDRGRRNGGSIDESAGPLDSRAARGREGAGGGSLGLGKPKGRDRLMQGLRLTLFAAIAAGAVSFVVHSRLPEVTSLGIRLGAGGQRARVRTGPARSVSVGSAASQQAAAASVYGYYILSRLSRQRAQAQEISTLRAMADNPKLSSKARAAAASNLDTVARWGREETEIETVLASQGFPQSVVVISNGRAMVVVPAKGLDAAKAARIGTDIWNLANIPPEEVIVQPHA